LQYTFGSAIIRELRGIVAEPSAQLTEALRAWTKGDEGALGKVIELAYPELRQIARRCLRMERSEHTMQATALVQKRT
jgi:hypothetical protein